ncbi:MAG TPA: PEP-CTERM sorting domain-containing protein [Leptolyngbyaceae cyanobacterium]
MNFHKPILMGFAVAASLVTTASTTLAATFSGDLFYTRNFTDATDPASVKKAVYNYDDIAHTLTLGNRISIANGGWGDGMVFAPDGDLIIGASQQVQKVNPNNGAILSSSAVGTNALHLALDPSGQKVWGGTEGPVGTNTPLAEIPLTPFGNAIPRPLTGDDLFITAIAFDNAGTAYYTAGGDDVNGSFGIIDMNTFTTKRLLSDIPSAHGMVFDPFTEDLILFRHNHITQIDPKNGGISDYALPTSVFLDGGTTDGNGHLFVADAANGNLVFMDYAASGQVGAAGNFVTTPFLDTHIDDIAPLSGPGSKHVPEPSSTLGLLALGTFGGFLLKRKQQRKVLDSRVS